MGLLADPLWGYIGKLQSFDWVQLLLMVICLY